MAKVGELIGRWGALQGEPLHDNYAGTLWEVDRSPSQSTEAWLRDVSIYEAFLCLIFVFAAVPFLEGQRMVE
jgi:hypothetical protein